MIILQAVTEGIKIEQILVANGVGLLVLLVYMLSRVEIKKERHISSKIFDAMVWIIFFALIAETFIFLIDGQPGKFIHVLQYITNGYLFLASSFVALLWVLFVDVRIFRSIPRIKRWFKALIIPYALIVALIIADFFGTGLIFSIGADNVYARGNIVLLTYVFVIVCYIITLVLAYLAVKRNGHIRFFPVYYFVIPSLLGTLVQGLFYGISTGWMLTSIALLFVQLHIANQNAYEDDLSGLYNRKYFGWMVEKLTRSKNNAFIGAIMMDIDRFKSINDKFGHSVGDDAIRSFGWILTNITTATTIAFRVGGDEFIVLHIGGTEEDLAKIKDAINEQLDEFNETEGKPYTLAVSMGASTCYTNDTSLDFFFHQLDLQMYEQKALRDKKRGNKDEK